MFLETLAAPVVASWLPVQDTPPIMTVRGPVVPVQLGCCLPHEHIVTDFIGADHVRWAPRYSRAAAVETILPHLKALRAKGISTLVECTPAYIGRDVRLLAQLAEASGLHILTNTGYYGAVGNRYLPQHAYFATPDQLARKWIAEAEQGIDGSSVRAGFIKLGVGNGVLTPLHQKLVRAAAQTHQATGLTIFIHTGDAEAARDELRILTDEGIAPEALVWVHAQNDRLGDTQVHLAEQGSWVSLDGYRPTLPQRSRYPSMLARLKEAGCLHRVLIAHDDGWAVEGNQRRTDGLRFWGASSVSPYQGIFEQLRTDLDEHGFDDADWHQLTVLNPAQALAPRKRLR
ncbi:MAG: aryldialkylphosphatase [Rhodothermales bacterium]